MVINMRYLLFCFLFFSYSALSQQTAPVCQQPFIYNSCIHNNNASVQSQYCVNSGGYSVGGSLDCSSWGLSFSPMACSANCSCPPGNRLNTVVNNGVSTTSCIPDEPTDNGDCQPPQVEYAGLCRDTEQNPEDCGSNYPTAVAAGSGYVCTDDENCGDGTNPTILTTANGSWKVCGTPDETPSSSGSNSSPPSSTPSGSDSSSGDSGAGGGGGGGGDDNSTTNPNQSSSSVSGGNPPTQSASSTSSASGAASSGSGSGNCDPTSHDYLACISRENPGNGDGSGDSFEPSGNKGSFDGEAAEQRQEQLENEIKQQMQTIKEEIKNHLGGDVSGSGGLSDKCVNVYNKQICFGFAKWQTDLQIIGQAILLLAGFLSLAIVLSR